MKKIRGTIIVTILVFAALMVYGLYAKKEHKKLNGTDNPIDNFYVALLPDDLLSNQLKLMRQTLDGSRYILEVTCKEKMQYEFSCAIQQVEIKKVFKGDNLQAGDTIDILKCDSIFPGIMDRPAINMAFVNEMTVGDTYLVFLDERIETYDALNIYTRSNDYFLDPIFSYDNNRQGFHPCEDTETNSALYATVKTEEYFLMSQQAVDEITAFKEMLFSKYPE